MIEFLDDPLALARLLPVTPAYLLAHPLLELPLALVLLHSREKSLASTAHRLSRLRLLQEGLVLPPHEGVLRGKHSLI